MRGIIAGAVRALEALRPAVGALDLAGLSWRQLRGFQRGAACLADCRDGHTYGPWCQLGWPIPGPSYLLHAFAEATMPLPEAPRRLHDEQLSAIHAALTEVAHVELPVDTPAPHQCFSGCAHWPDGFDGETLEEVVARARERLADELQEPERPPGEAEKIAEGLFWIPDPGRLPEDWPPMSSPGYTQGLAAYRDVLNGRAHRSDCASIEDAEGKAGPCDCGAEEPA